MTQRERYSVTLEAKADEVPSTIRLRRLLKVALRAFGLKCIGVTRIDHDQDDDHDQDVGTPRGGHGSFQPPASVRFSRQRSQATYTPSVTLSRIPE